MDAPDYLEFARDLAHEAGRMAMAAFRRTDAVVKDTGDGRDLVTQADEEIEAFLTERIFEAYPRHQILGEEEGLVTRCDEPEPVVWVVDPVDGTFNFSAGLPFFGICIGVCVDCVPQVGVIELPALGETFWATRGEGAFCNGQRLTVDTEGTPQTALVDVCGRDLFRLFAKLGDTGHDRRLLRILACMALDTAYIAAGRLGAVLHTSINTWDLAAGSVLVEEAGGLMTDFTGQPIFPNYLDQWLRGERDKFRCIVSPPQLHGPLMDFVRGIAPQALGGS